MVCPIKHNMECLSGKPVRDHVLVSALVTPTGWSWHQGEIWGNRITLSACHALPVEPAGENIDRIIGGDTHGSLNPHNVYWETAMTTTAVKGEMDTRSTKKDNN